MCKEGSKNTPAYCCSPSAPHMRPCSSRDILKTCNLEISCKSLTQSSSSRTRGSSINTAWHFCYRAYPGCLAQPPSGPLHAPRQQKRCRGVAADNVAALPREDLRTGHSYALRVRTPNCKRRLPTNCLPTHHACSSDSKPKSQIPNAPLPSKMLCSSTELLHAPRMLL